MNDYIYLLALVLCCAACQPQPEKQTPEEATTQQDPLAPTDSGADALTGRLAVATLSTTNLEATRQFYVAGWGLTLDGPLAVDERLKTQQRSQWDIPADIDYDMYLLHRPAVPDLIKIRLLHLKQETPHIHSGYSSRELGPFSLGFPNANQEQIDQKLRGMEFKSMAPMQEGTIPRPDGTSYRYIETIYQAPDFVHVVGIERKDGMAQLAPIDSTTLLGGPGYSAQVLEDSDTFLAFLTDVLDLELRSDRHWESSPGSALGIEEGVPFRFSLVYAKGESHGHLLFLDYEEDEFEALNATPKVPNQGLGMWSFPVRDISAIAERASAKGITIVQPPMKYDSPIFGSRQVMTMLAPNGFLVEVFE